MWDAPLWIYPELEIMQMQKTWDKAGGETMEHLANRDDEEVAGGEKEL